MVFCSALVNLDVQICAADRAILTTLTVQETDSGRVQNEEAIAAHAVLHCHDSFKPSSARYKLIGETEADDANTCLKWGNVLLRWQLS